MNQEQINKVYELIDDIKQSDVYLQLVDLNMTIKESAEIQEKQRLFLKLRDKYEDVKKYGKYHPDLKRIQHEFSIAKEALYNIDEVKRYKQNEKELQKVLDQISIELGQSVSSLIPVPNEIGLISKKKDDING